MLSSSTQRSRKPVISAHVPVVLLAYLSCLLHTSHAQGITLSKYYTLDRQNAIVPPKSIVSSSKGIILPQCALMCLQEPSCQGFSFNTAQGRCDMFSDTGGMGMRLYEYAPGTNSYIQRSLLTAPEPVEDQPHIPTQASPNQCNESDIPKLVCEDGGSPVEVVAAMRYETSSAYLFGGDGYVYECDMHDIETNNGRGCEQRARTTDLFDSGVTDRPDAAFAVLDPNDAGKPSSYIIFKGSTIYCYVHSDNGRWDDEACNQYNTEDDTIKAKFGDAIPTDVDAVAISAWSSSTQYSVAFAKDGQVYESSYLQPSPLPQELTADKVERLLGTPTCGITALLAGATSGSYIRFRGSYIYDKNSVLLGRFCNPVPTTLFNQA